MDDVCIARKECLVLPLDAPDKKLILMRRRKGVSTVLIVMPALLGLSLPCLGGEEEPLVPHKKGEEQGVTLWLTPVLKDTSLHPTDVHPLKITLRKISQTPSRCLDHAYLMYGYRDRKAQKVGELPIKISLAKADGLPSEGKVKTPSIGTAICATPNSRSLIEVRAEEATLEEFNKFLDQFPDEKKEKMKKAITPLDPYRFEFEIRDIQNPGACLRLELEEGFKRKE